MDLINNFNDYIKKTLITESGIQIDKMKFVVMPAQYSVLTGLEFIPDFWTEKDYNKPEMLRAIENTLKRKDDFLYQVLQFRPLSYSDGLFFEINTELIMDRIIKTFGK